MDYVFIYLIGIVISAIVTIIAANGEEIFIESEPIINIISIILSLILWPVYFIAIIVIIRNIIKGGLR